MDITGGTLFRLDESWGRVDTIIPFGYGRVGRRALPKLREMFRIPFVIDNGGCRQDAEGIRIYDLTKGIAQRKEEKIVVLTVGTAYESIKRELERCHLKEYKDFCILERFLGEWHLKYRNELFLSKIDTVLTSRCTLSCGHCAMFVPHCKDKKDCEPERLFRNFDALFGGVDYVLEYTLMGGEPLIYSGLEKVITYLSDHYGKRIGQIVLISNGNADPSDELLVVLKKKGVMISISDYTKQSNYKKTLDRLTARLDKMGIPYSFNAEMEWKDHGYPLNPYNYSDEEMPKHMVACGHSTHSMNDGKLYYCDAMYGAEVNTGYATEPDDILDFNEARVDMRESEWKRRILEYCMGNVGEKGFPSFCSRCGGIGEDNRNVVPAGT